MKVQNYRFKCRNQRCAAEFLRAYRVDEFEKNQYSTSSGWACFQCGFPKMAVIKSNRMAKHSFVPGFQRNIGKFCKTFSEYKQKIKEMGLVEICFEDIPEDDGPKVNYWSEEMIKKVVANGVELSGREVEAMKNGKMFDDAS
jgi:hypothetical protein